MLVSERWRGDAHICTCVGIVAHACRISGGQSVGADANLEAVEGDDRFAAHGPGRHASA